MLFGDYSLEKKSLVLFLWCVFFSFNIFYWLEIVKLIVFTNGIQLNWKAKNWHQMFPSIFLRDISIGQRFCPKLCFQSHCEFTYIYSNSEDNLRTWMLTTTSSYACQIFQNTSFIINDTIDFIVRTYNFKVMHKFYSHVSTKLTFAMWSKDLPDPKRWTLTCYITSRVNDTKSFTK